MSRVLVALLIFFLPSCLAGFFLKLVGYRIGKNVKIGFSVILVDKLILENGVKIGHGNFIAVRNLILKPSTKINRFNVLHGPLSILLKKGASIGNRNKITRGPLPSVVAWKASLILGDGAIITSDHLLDCTRSIHIGAYSILAGSGSQLWTHGYVHDMAGPGRYRVDGRIYIYNNVYVGSRCIITPCVFIASGCTIGAGAVVSKPLVCGGLYVAAPLRSLPNILDPEARQCLQKETAPELCEKVFYKELDRSFIKNNQI